MYRHLTLWIFSAGLALAPTAGRAVERPGPQAGGPTSAAFAGAQVPIPQAIPGLVGSWRMTRFVVSNDTGGPVDLIAHGGAGWLTFDADGRFVLTRQEAAASTRVAETGDWKPLSAQSIELDGDGAAPSEVYGVTVAGDLLLMCGSLTIDLDEDGIPESATLESELRREPDKQAEGAGIVGAWVRSDGRVRTYRLHVPEETDEPRPIALVLAFHGGADSGESMQSFSGLDAAADEVGAAVVYPDALRGHWAIGCDCTPADREGVRDVLFAERLIDQLAAEYPIDPTRIFATGFSQGAMFVSRLACDVPHRVAAVATAGGGLTRVLADRCAPGRPVPVLAFHGTADPSVPYFGNATMLPVPLAVETWARIDGCGGAVDEPMPDSSDDGTLVTRTRYADCATASEVVLYTIEGGGHTWPGAAVTFEPRLGPVTRDVAASPLALEFFSRHALPH